MGVCIVISSSACFITPYDFFLVPSPKILNVLATLEGRFFPIRLVSALTFRLHSSHLNIHPNQVPLNSVGRKPAILLFQVYYNGTIQPPFSVLGRVHSITLCVESVSRHIHFYESRGDKKVFF